MLVAELCGKLGAENPPDERSEDLLTSQVLSLFRYVSNLTVPSLLLARARNLSDTPWPDRDFDRIETYFWPRFIMEGDTRSREPDAVFLLSQKKGACLKVVIEAKYGSGPSPVEGTPADSTRAAGMMQGNGLSGNQLADEYCALKCGWWLEPELMRCAPDEGRLLYVTAHYELPRADFEDAVEALQEKRIAPECCSCVEKALRDMYWLGWRDIYEELAQAKAAGYYNCLPGEAQFMEDVRLVLERKGLRHYRLQLDLLQLVQEYSSFFQQTEIMRLGGYKDLNRYTSFWR